MDKSKVILSSVVVFLFVSVGIGAFITTTVTKGSFFSFSTNASQVTSADREIEARLDEIISRKSIPGISLSVVSSGKVKTYVAGFADKEEMVRITSNHRMLTGSVGKSFFAALALKLASNGVLGLEEKAETYLKDSDWFENISNHESITIKSLLNHTSGVPEYVYSSDLWQSLKQNPDKQWTVADRMQLISDAAAHFPVGSGWSYADANYIILGAVLENATGKDVYQLVEEHLFNPQNIPRTTPSTTQKLEDLTAGYTGGYFGKLFDTKIASMGKYDINPQFEWTGGGYVTTSADLSKWINKLYSGQVLNNDMTSKMFSPFDRQTGQPDSTGYGLGAEVFETRFGKGYGHTGFMPGFSTFMAYFPNHDLSLAFQINIDPYNTSLASGTSVFTVADDLLPMFISKSNVFSQPTTIYFIRHAETQVGADPRNPGLSKAGNKRAQDLATEFSAKKISAIYSTSYKRTMQTAIPIAKQLGLDVSAYNPSDVNGVFDMIAKNEGDSILVVGHSNTVPNTINYLLRDDRLDTIPEDEYDHMYKVIYSSDRQFLETLNQ